MLHTAAAHVFQSCGRLLRDVLSSYSSSSSSSSSVPAGWWMREEPDGEGAEPGGRDGGGGGGGSEAVPVVGRGGSGSGIQSSQRVRVHGRDAEPSVAALQVHGYRLQPLQPSNLSIYSCIAEFLYKLHNHSGWDPVACSQIALP
jgi:hypothetical protein